MADDYLSRTAITRPILTDEHQQLLDFTIHEWKQACNISSQIGWNAGETRKTYLQDLACDDMMEETRLGSQHAILATHQAPAALDGAEEIEDLNEDYKSSRPARSGRKACLTGLDALGRTFGVVTGRRPLNAPPERELMGRGNGQP